MRGMARGSVWLVLAICVLLVEKVEGQCAAGQGGSPCTSCLAGKYSLGGTGAVCTNCPAGTYRSSAGATALSDCTACAAGSYGITSTGQTTQATACPSANTCPSNLWSAPGSSSSSACVGCVPNSASAFSAGGGTMTTDVPGYNVHRYLATGGVTTTVSVTFSRDVVADVLVVGVWLRRVS